MNRLSRDGVEPESGPYAIHEPGSRYVNLLADAWREGKIANVEQFFAEYPESAADSEIAVRLIYEEFCLRQEAGHPAVPQEILDRFPRWKSKLEIVLDCHQLVLATHGTPEFPSLGEQLGEFRLLSELGRGAQGRVFLATQPSLSHRPVVVKIVPCRGQEHLSLALLQHVSIVPLYSVQEHHERNLRLLCMPFVGGISLDRMLDLLAPLPLSQRTGRHLVEALESACRELPVTFPCEGPALQFLPLTTYVQAVCWIGACVAEALQYAHGRGVLHLDLKPSNVLLAGVGQPMLLDFHLARNVNATPDHLSLDWLGGTPGYMSPEQEEACRLLGKGLPVPKTLDGRSDIYSWGLVLYELLGGPPPDASGARVLPTDRSFGSHVPPRVATIVQKCLAMDPVERFESAGHLASELRNCLIGEDANTRTRKGAPTSTPLENRQWSWLRSAVLWSTLAVISAIGGYYAALRNRGAARIDDSDRRPTLQWDGNHQQMADELHVLVDQLRFLDRLDSLPVARLRKLEIGCREVWNRRARAFPIPGPAAADHDQQLRSDLLDLAILWAELHVFLASDSEVQEAQREALAMLAEAESELGGSRVLSRERRVYAAALGLTEPSRQAVVAAEQLEPVSVWEHYAVGRSHLRNGQLDLASREFQLAVDLDPSAFWPNFYQGICSYRRQELEAALAAFSACVTLKPRQAACYFNRALAYQALGRSEWAAHDFETAKRLDPIWYAAVTSAPAVSRPSQ